MAKRRAPLFWLGCAVLACFGALAALAPALAPYDPRLPTGQPLTTPTADHLLGTNDLGQDVLSQLIHGARSTLIVAVGVTALSTVLSWLVGLAAGLSRRAEAPLLAVVDLLLALPGLPLYLLVLTLVGPTRLNVVLVLGLLSWPAFARIVRGVVIQTRAAPYVEASRALGAPALHVARRHVLPATLDVLPTKLVLTVRFAVFAEATLAFLGLSAGESTGWGQMLSWAFADPLLFARPVWPWLVIPPMLAIALLLLATVWVSVGFGPIVAPSPGRRPAATPVRDRRPTDPAAMPAGAARTPSESPPAIARTAGVVGARRE